MRTGVRRDRGLRGHRQEGRDGVALAYPQLEERLREAAHLARQLGPGQRASLAFLGRPHGRLAVRPFARPAVHAGIGDVEPCTEKPGRPLDSARFVEHLVPRASERDAEIVHDRAPEAVGLVDRDGVELLVRVAGERAREPGDVGGGDLLG